MLQRVQIVALIGLTHLCLAYGLLAHKFTGARQPDPVEAATTLGVIPTLFFVRSRINSDAELLPWVPVNSLLWALAIFFIGLGLRKLIRRRAA